MNIPVNLAKIYLHNEIVPDIPAKIRDEFQTIVNGLHPGMKIAVTVGSRGISNIKLIVKTVIDCLLEERTNPFIVPAMGSHGGATAEGQRELLAGYGITEETMGVPIRSSMEVVKIEEITEPVFLPVYMDKYAWEADGVLGIGRVKCHTDFHGSHESGIVKMFTIGLGKQAQALAVHAYGSNGLRDYIPLVSRRIIQSGKVLGALAILEDGYDHTADLKFAKPEDIFRIDAEFLVRSKEMIARLPFEEIDVLIVDMMGKEISGTGLDTNVIGRIRIPEQEDGRPLCHKIVVLNLSEASHGNALGVGLADVIPRSLADSIDWNVTNENVITSGFLQRGFLPVVAENDEEAVSIALRTCGKPMDGNLKVARIQSTLNLEKVYVSDALLDDLMKTGKGEYLGRREMLSFDKNGKIADFI